jgi:hypothetical protein
MLTALSGVPLGVCVVIFRAASLFVGPARRAVIACARLEPARST